EHVGEVRSIGHQAARFDVLALHVDRRQTRDERKRIDTDPVYICEWIANNIERIHAPFEGLKGGRDVLSAPDFQRNNFEAEGTGRLLKLMHLQHCGTGDIGHDRQTVETRENVAQDSDTLGAEADPTGWWARVVRARTRWR